MPIVSKHGTCNDLFVDQSHQEEFRLLAEFARNVMVWVVPRPRESAVFPQPNDCGFILTTKSAYEHKDLRICDLARIADFRGQCKLGTFSCRAARVRLSCADGRAQRGLVVKTDAQRHLLPAFLFAPGAGAPSSSDWMQSFARQLGDIGRVECFDYPYQRAGRRSPDRLPVLVAAHQAAYEHLRAEHAGPLFLIGKSMGGRMGCHLANQLAKSKPVALVCLGYPLVGQKGAVRDEVLLELSTPILFIQGTRDPLCPLERLATVRTRMSASNTLHVVQGGDHSLRVTARALATQGLTQAEVDTKIVHAVRDFIEPFVAPAASRT